MFGSSVHLAPNAPWLVLVLLTVAVVALGIWAYRFAIPPLPALARRALPALRVIAMVVLLWLLAQPVLERVSRGGARVVVLLDRSRSMDLPTRLGGPPRSQAADEAVTEIKRALRGRAAVEVLPFAGRLGSDSAQVENRGSTALGDALGALSQMPQGQGASGVVVVSDGAVNAGDDPVAAAGTIGVPVHGVVVGETNISDRVIIGVESPSESRVGSPTPVRVRVTTTEERGVPIGVHLLEGGRELAKATIISPGQGQEAAADLRVTPVRPGLAVWTARIDSVAGEISTLNNQRQVAMEIAPGRLGVLILSSGLNWDIAFLRRSLAGDSSLSVVTWVRERGGWKVLERARNQALSPAALNGQTVVVLDAIAPGEMPGGFDQALAEFVRRGGAILAMGGPPPGLARYRAGRLGSDLVPALGRPAPTSAAPLPAPEASDLLAWDDDPARGERAWRAAAPLSDLVPLAAGAGDRVLIRSQGIGPPIMLVRRIGRGQALLVNGTGLWRWSLSGHDDLGQDRGRRLWRGLVHWLTEPVQAEPLRVRPERWLTARGEPVRLFATLQDDEFKPVAGAKVEGELRREDGGAERVAFVPGPAGSYVGTLPEPRPGRYHITVRATRGGTDLGRASTEFAVDRWSLEEARTLPDSVTLAAVARASGGSMAKAAQTSRWVRTLQMRTLAARRTDSTRLWESPWLFGVIVGALSVEWAWRRKRGLP